VPQHAGLFIDQQHRAAEGLLEGTGFLVQFKPAPRLAGRRRQRQHAQRADARAQQLVHHVGAMPRQLLRAGVVVGAQVLQLAHGQPAGQQQQGQHAQCDQPRQVAAQGHGSTLP
jgi:hypothetical protein